MVRKYPTLFLLHPNIIVLTANVPHLKLALFTATVEKTSFSGVMGFAGVFLSKTRIHIKFVSV